MSVSRDKKREEKLKGRRRVEIEHSLTLQVSSCLMDVRHVSEKKKKKERELVRE